MAVNLYCGDPGSGKTYEVVAFVIVPAMARGRRVVTNIAGIDEAAIRDYLMMEEKVDPTKIGEIISVTFDDVRLPGFFPKIGSGDDSVVRAGDLVVMDEIWELWGAACDGGISPEHMTFFRKHRHLTHPDTGVSCDLVIISQRPDDVHRKLRGVVEFSYEATKLKLLKLPFSKKPPGYKVRMFQGPSQRRKPVTVFQKTYNRKIFPLYNSYSGGTGAAGVEAVIDDRQSVFNRPSVWVMAIFVVCAVFWGVSHTMAFFWGEKPKRQEYSEPVGASLPVPAERAKAINDRISGVSSAVQVNLVEPVKTQITATSTVWRLAGFLRFKDRVNVLLIDGAGRIRYADPGQFSFEDGKPVAGIVDGEKVTPWSGVAVGGSSTSVAPVRDIRPGIVAGG